MRGLPGRVLVAGGTVVAPPDVFRADVLAEDGVIVAVGPDLPRAGARVYDAGGCIVLPGAVDAHTHFSLDLGFARVSDGFAQGTKAAAMGGVTCVVEHPGFGPQGCSLTHQVEVCRALAQGQSCVDFAVHGVAQSAAQADEMELEALVRSGCPSVKAYTTYAGRLDEAGLLALMDAAATCRGKVVVAVHCEDHALVAYHTARLRARGRTDPAAHPLSRPGHAEALAVRLAVELARATGATLYVVHLSTAEGARAVAEAKAQGVAVLAETCPQYLLLDESLYEGPDALAYVMSPPLRTRADREALWRALAEGVIDVAATDHCAVSLEDKARLGGADVFSCPGGAAGAGARLPLLHTFGVEAGRLDLARLAEVCCEAPARVFGLESKGRLAPGMDADVCVLDPSLERAFGGAQGPGADSPVYRGLSARGWPRHVLCRGRAVVEDGIFTGAPGWGLFTPRTLTGRQP